MPLIRLQNLSKTFPNKVIAREISFHFPTGKKIGLVGANGTGKSTLFKIICGQEEPDGGSVITPQEAVLGFLPQEPNPHPKATVIEECEAGAEHVEHLKQQLEITLAELEKSSSPEALLRYEQLETSFQQANGYQINARAQSILAGLGFPPDLLEKSPLTLSGGMRMRLELAKIFIKSPDILLLDEPTNHLDLPSLVWVENYLKNYRGTVIIISHDRSLLNRIVDLIVHLDGGDLIAYHGNYDSFEVQRAERQRMVEANLDQLNRRQKELQGFIDRFGAKASKAKQAQSRVKMVEKLEEEKSNLVAPQTSVRLKLRLPKPPPSSRILLTTKGVSIGYSELVLAENISFILERGHKVAIIGANGIGKSTLLKTLVGLTPVLKGEVTRDDKTKFGYFSQDQASSLDGERDIITNLMMRSELGERQARDLLGAFLFSGEDVFKPVKVLSGGELNRVGLACVLAKDSNLLVLDEPTNHLDMSSIDALTGALAEYEGTAIFVSHNRDFINATCTHILAMLKDGRSFFCEGRIDDFRTMAAIAGFPDVLGSGDDGSALKKSQELNTPPSSQTTHENPTRFKDLKRERSRLEKLVPSLEGRLSTLETQKVSLQHDLATTDSHNYSALAEMQTRIDQLQSQIETAEEQWLQASEELTNISQKLEEIGRG